MATKIVQTAIKFYSELVNGSDFTENTGVYTDALADGVTGRCKVVTTVEISVGMEISNFALLPAGANLASATNTLYKIVQTGANFVDEGFTIGCSVEIYLDPPPTAGTDANNASFTVTSITADELYLEVTNPTVDGLALLYANSSSATFPYFTQPGYIAIDPNMDGLIYSYNLVENDGSPTLISSLTSTINTSKVKQIPSTVDGTVQTGVTLSQNKAWVMGDMTVEFKAKVQNNNVYVVDQLFANRYEISQEFTIPYYYDDEDDNLDNTTLPPDLYNGSSSPKYIYETTWFTDVNNVNTGITTKYDTDKGASGYFNEAFNGDANPYTIDSLVYTDENGDVTDRLSTNSTVSVAATISNSDADFDVDQIAVLAHGAIVDSDSYSNSVNDFDTVWTYETLRNSVSGGSQDGANFIENFNITYTDASTISIAFDITFQSAQIAVLEEDQYYVLALQIRNDNEPIVMDSHKVHLLLDYNQYGRDNDIDGLFGVARFEQIPHPDVLTTDITDTTGYTNAQYDIEEGALSLIEFWLDTSKDAVLESLNFQVGVWDNAESNLDAVITDTRIDLSDAVLVGTSWKLRLNDTIGYTLADGDQFNYKVLTTGELVGSKQFYTLLVGYKMPWQPWIALPDAPTDFYAVDEDNDGLNKKSSKYSEVGDYQIRLFLDAYVSQDSVSTQYLTSSESIKTYDYDEDDTGTSTYDCSIDTYNELDVSIENNMLEEDYTKIVATFTPAVTPVFSTQLDFTEVSDDWNRYAHGNLYYPTSGSGERLGIWENDQANDTDTFEENPTTFTKNDPGLYTSTTNTILAEQNAFAVYGCYSILKYEYYSITGNMYSDNTSDNDTLIYDICFIVDDFGVEHTLSLCATTGGITSGVNPNFDGTTDTSTIWFSSDVANWSLVYDFGKREAVNLYQFDTTVSGLNWGAVGDFAFSVSRQAAEIVISGDWTVGGIQFTDEYTYDLNDNDTTTQFLGANYIGFGFMSQDQGGFKDVEIDIPADDFWAAIRVESEESAEPKGIFELSNDIEGDTSNLLKQVDSSSDVIVSSLDWADPSFFLSCLVNTDIIKSGESYKVSAEIGAIDVGTLELFATFAWIDSDTPSKLNVMFNSYVSSSAITGISLTNSGLISVSAIDYIEDNFIVYDLDGDMLTNTGLSMQFSGTDIDRISDNVNLSTTTIDIYNDI